MAPCGAPKASHNPEIHVPEYANCRRPGRFPDGRCADHSTDPAAIKRRLTLAERRRIRSTNEPPLRLGEVLRMSVRDYVSLRLAVDALGAGVVSAVIPADVLDAFCDGYGVQAIEALEAAGFSVSPVTSNTDLTPAAVAERVQHIADVGGVKGNPGDPEKAHGLEDALHQDVLAEIAERWPASDAGKLARAALGTTHFNFPRWSA